MATSTIQDIKNELQHHNQKQLLSYCLRLAKFKKENKELLTFILFEEKDMVSFTEKVNNEVTGLFEAINNSNVYYVKKSVRKILRYINKQIRFAAMPQATAELLIHFCNSIIDFSIPLRKSVQLMKLYDAQFKKAVDTLSGLHPDLQYDLRKQLRTK